MPTGEKTKLLWQNSEYRKHMIKMLIGRKLSIKHRKKLSKIAKQKGFGLWMIGKKASLKTREKMKLRKGEKASHWKGGRKIDKDGYIYIFQPNHPFCNNVGYIFEHRFVIEQKLGRYLEPEERAHHINGIKNDNRIENLQLFINEIEHQKFHHPKGIKVCYKPPYKNY